MAIKMDKLYGGSSNEVDAVGIAAGLAVILGEATGQRAQRSGNRLQSISRAAPPLRVTRKRAALDQCGSLILQGTRADL
jgi:hypothetical protein